MIGAIVSFTLMAVAGRAISFELDTFEIMMYRSLVGIFILGTFLSLTGNWSRVERGHTGLHLIRNVCHFAGQNLWFFALTAIPLAQVFALEFTSPLWVLILSPLLLGEKLTRLRSLSAVLGFIGILIVARPSPETVTIGTIAAAIAAIGFAGAIIFTKQLTRVTTLASILLYMTITQAIFGLICAGIDGAVVWPSSNSMLWLVVIGCGGLLAHFCITNALAIAPATVVTPVDFARLPVIAIVGYLFYNEQIDAFVLIGALIIFGANYLNIWSETRK
ncbi:DMT family transporter [Roseovarius aestuarii]|uniref:Riboflavin transporter n=1 Tax=Roseovarius aestuarii TaxID=475083 RepID=A0A1X7BNI3_9RHOB|nr:Riboflavin transporter [Roseovarius aestuarii]